MVHYIMVHHLMVRYIVSIRHFLTLYNVKKILFDASMQTHVVLQLTRPGKLRHRVRKTAPAGDLEEPGERVGHYKVAKCV